MHVNAQREFRRMFGQLRTLAMQEMSHCDHPPDQVVGTGYCEGGGPALWAVCCKCGAHNPINLPQGSEPTGVRILSATEFITFMAGMDIIHGTPYELHIPGLGKVTYI